MLAAGGGHTDVVDLLLDRGAQVDAAIESSLMAVASAARYGQPEIIGALDKEPLTDCGERWTALRFAEQWGSPGTIHSLLEAGAKR
jgi:hypothetical protein